MGRPQVSIRLGTTGRSDVERDFAAIGDSGEAQARRYQNAWERASAQAEAALDRQAKAAARLEAASATPIQSRINSATGVGAVQSGGARASAAALAAELDHAEQEARQLIAAMDPLFAAQARYAAQVERIEGVRKTGQLDEQRYQQLLAHEKVLLDEATAAGMRNAGMRGNMRMGMQQLGFQLNDVTSQMAMGTRASVIFAQQSGQTIQALQLMGGEGNRFLRFLGGPWGIALSVAASALIPMIARLAENKEALGPLIDKMREHADQADRNRQAEEAWRRTTEGLTEAIRKRREEQEKSLRTDIQAESRALQSAKDDLATQRGNLAQAERDLQGAKDKAGAIRLQGNSSNYGPDYAALSRADAEVKRLASEVATAKASIVDAERTIRQAEIPIIQRGVEAKLDPLKKATDEYTRALGKLNDQRQAGIISSRAYETQLDAESRKLEKAKKDAQERDRKPGANAGGTAIFDGQIASFFDIAAKYRGKSETRDRIDLKSFLGNVDPVKTAWCAAFVNAVLAAGGVSGTGSLAAGSFMNYGKDDMKSPQRGDIVVVKSGASPSGQHVGFLDSIDKNGNVRVLGGNTGDKVAAATYAKDKVLAIRRPPTPSESAAAADKAASDAISQGQAFESEREKLNQQYLQALSKLNAGAEAQASFQLQRVQGEHDAEQKQIEANLAAGKYGEATGELAQSRAKQLLAANDNVLKERKAGIAMDANVKAMREQDAASEREAKYKVDALSYAQSIAKTSSDRRKLGQDIIDIEYRERDAHLKYLLALATLLGNTEDAARVAAELAQLPKERERDEDKNDRENQGPLKDYYDKLPGNMHEASDIIQRDLVGAFEQLNGGLTDALMKSKNFHDLWKNMKAVAHDFAATLLKDLIDLAIKMFVIKPLLNAIGGGMGMPGFASGTEYAPGGMAWVGENGPEMVRLPRGSKVHTAADSRRMIAANDRGGARVSVTNYNDFRGADAASVGAIGSRVDRLEAEIPSMAVAAVQNAEERFVLRGTRR